MESSSSSTMTVTDQKKFAYFPPKHGGELQQPSPMECDEQPNLSGLAKAREKRATLKKKNKKKFKDGGDPGSDDSNGSNGSDRSDEEADESDGTYVGNLFDDPEQGEQKNAPPPLNLQPKPVESQSVPPQPKRAPLQELNMNSQLAELHQLRADRAASERARKTNIAREEKAARKAARKIAKLERALQPSLNKQTNDVIDDIITQTASQLENIAPTLLQHTSGFRKVVILDDGSLPNVPSIDASVRTSRDNETKLLGGVRDAIHKYVNGRGNTTAHIDRKKRKMKLADDINQGKANARRAKRVRRDEMDRARDNQ